jgi:hypothetical protein
VVVPGKSDNRSSYVLELYLSGLRMEGVGGPKTTLREECDSGMIEPRSGIGLAQNGRLMPR